MATLSEELRQQKVLDHGYVKFIDSMGTDETIVEAARMSTGRGFVSWEAYERCSKCGGAWLWAPSGLLGGLDEALSSNAATGVTRLQIIGASCHDKDDTACGKVEKFPRGDVGFLESLYSGRYLTEPPHIGPFEMAELCVEQQHPIFVERQYARHRTLIALFSLNEFSARYAVLPDLFYVPSRERLHNAAQDVKNKQGSAAGLPDAAVAQATALIERGHGAAREIYEALLGLGLARELARGVIGVFQYTRLRRKANLRNWLQAAELRLDLHAQWEAQETFVSIKKLLAALWPRTWALFEEYTLGAVRFSKTEIAALRAGLKSIDNDQGAATSVEGYLDNGTITDKAKRAAFLKKLRLEG